MSADARAAALQALSQFLITEVSLGDTLLRVAEITTDALPAAEMAGISMLDDDGRPTTAIYTDEASPEIDSGQYQSGKGPCLDAWREQRIVRVDDMTASADTYPEFSQLARDHGVQSTLSFPLVAAKAPVGALNLYSRELNGFSTDDEAVGSDLAAAAAIVLANANAYSAASQLSSQLTEAMKSRAVIEQAKGMLMAQARTMTADEAFEVLRKASQRENIKLRDIAQRIVDRKPLSGNGGL